MCLSSSPSYAPIAPVEKPLNNELKLTTDGYDPALNSHQAVVDANYVAKSKAIAAGGSLGQTGLGIATSSAPASIA
jgi:hypothetical protein